MDKPTHNAKKWKRDALMIVKREAMNSGTSTSTMVWVCPVKPLATKPHLLGHTSKTEQKLLYKITQTKNNLANYPRLRETILCISAD